MPQPRHGRAPRWTLLKSKEGKTQNALPVVQSDVFDGDQSVAVLSREIAVDDGIQSRLRVLGAELLDEYALVVPNPLQQPVRVAQRCRGVAILNGCDESL